MITQFIGQAKVLAVVVNAQESQHGDEHCKSSVSIAIMSWHVHKNVVKRAVNLYNEFA